MFLDTATRLEIVLSGAVAADQPEVHVWYVDYNKENHTVLPAMYRTATNNTTDVIILPAPINNPRRRIVSISVYNKDSAAVTVTIKTDDGTTERIILKKQLQTTETLFYYDNDHGEQ